MVVVCQCSNSKIGAISRGSDGFDAIGDVSDAIVPIRQNTETGSKLRFLFQPLAQCAIEYGIGMVSVGYDEVLVE